MQDIDLDEIATVTESAAEIRKIARANSIRACRILESALIHALQSEPLRGLPNLGTSACPFYAGRVRGKPDTQLPPEKWSLVVNPHGLLVMAKPIVVDGDLLDVRTAPVLDEELLAEDCERLATCLAILLPRHIAKTKAAEQKFEAFAVFSAKVEALFGTDGEGKPGGGRT
jgi:hypothetical protein